MALSLKTEHLKRYKDVMALLIKYGRGDLVEGDWLVEMAMDIVNSIFRTLMEQ